MNINPNHLLNELVNAMTALTEQIRKKNAFDDEQDKRLKQKPEVLRSREDERWGGAPWFPTPARSTYEAPPDPYSTARQAAPNLPPDASVIGGERPTLRNIIKGGITKPYQRGVGQYNRQIQEYQDKQRMPPNAVGDEASNDDILHSKAAPWLLMQNTPGAPQALRNVILGSYATSKSADWLGQAASGLGQRLQDPNTLTGRVFGGIPGAQGATTAATGLANLASEHSTAAYLGMRTIGSINEKIGTMRSIGEILGYQSGGNRSFLGHQTGGGTQALISGGLTAAEREGLSIDVEKERLMGRLPFGGGSSGFGFGLSKAQATDIASSLANMGFGNDASNTATAIQGKGNLSRLGQEYMGPMLKAFPGLKAEDLGQFVEQTRYGASSITDLRVALGDLGDVANETQRTIPQVTASINDYMQATAAQGGNTVAGMSTAREWMQSTGMQADVLAKAVQSPLVQGMAFAKSGVMPWALAQSGTQASSATLDTVQMLAGATGGMNQATTDKWGNKHSGLANQAGFIAQQTGMPIQQVEAMMRNPKRFEARMHAQSVLDDQTTENSYINKLAGMGAVDFDPNTGKMITKKGVKYNAQQTADLNKQWTGQIDPILKQAGASAADIKKWDKEKPVERMQDVQKFLGEQSGNDQNTPGKTTVDVNINLKGKAAHIFTADKTVSNGKGAINAGQDYMNQSTLNQLATNPYWNHSLPPR